MMDPPAPRLPEVMDRAALSAAGKPVRKERWAGVVDTVCSHGLANVVAQTMYGGARTPAWAPLASDPDSQNWR